MWEFVCQHDIYRPTYQTASRPTGLDGIVALLDGYDASQRSRYCITYKFISRCNRKQMKARLILKYVEIDMTT